MGRLALAAAELGRASDAHRFVSADPDADHALHHAFRADRRKREQAAHFLAVPAEQGDFDGRRRGVDCRTLERIGELALLTGGRQVNQVAACDLVGRETGPRAEGVVHFDHPGQLGRV